MFRCEAEMRSSGRTVQKNLRNPFMLIEAAETRGFSLVSHEIELYPLRNISLEAEEQNTFED